MIDYGSIKSLWWGDWVGSPGKRMRVGVDWGTIPTAGGAPVTVTPKAMIQTEEAITDASCALTWSGVTGSGSGTASVATSAYGTQVIKTFGATSLALDQDLTLNLNLSGVEAVGAVQATIAAVINVPNLGSRTPAPQTNMVATVLSDTEILLSWTNHSGEPDSSHKYDSIDIDRWDSYSGSWKLVVAGASKTMSSYSDRSVKAGRTYRYTVRAVDDSDRTSRWVSSQFVSTTPLAPANVAFTKAVSDVKLTWSNPDSIALDVEVWDTPGGGSLTKIATLAAGATTYTVLAPSPAVSHLYSVRNVAVQAAGMKASAYTTSSVIVSTLAKPNAPTLTSPSAKYVDAVDAITFTGVHNPADSTSITALEIQWREVGSSTWLTTNKTTVGSFAYSMAANTLTNLKSWEWRARTWGQHADPSDWSPVATFGTEPKPVATITRPADGEVITSDVIELVWDFYSSTDRVQASYRAVLTRDGVAVASLEGTGPTQRTAVLDYRLTDGATYTLLMQVVDSTGQASLVRSRTNAVDFLEPPAPTVAATWSPTLGAVVLAITNPANGSLAAASYNRIYRLAPDGTWTLMADSVPLSTAVTDSIPEAVATNSYRVVTVSTLSTTATTEVTIDTPNQGDRFWLNSGAGFGEVFSCRYDPSTSSVYSRPQVTRHFAGRAKPVSFTGIARDRKVSVKAILFSDETGSDRQAAEDVIDQGGVACYRDPFGRRLFVSFDEASFTEGADVTSISLSLTEVDYDEEVGA